MTPRESWLLANAVPGLLRTIQARQSRDMDAESAFALFRAADPSRNASTTQWLMRTYVAGGLLLEDLQGGQSSKAWNALDRFAVQVHQRLEGRERSLYQYATLDALCGAVESHVASVEDGEDDNAAGRALRRLERTQARAQSLMLREDSVATICVPLTEFAARWWGRGTRWCTSAKQDNAFWKYARAPLFIVTLAGGERVQTHASGGAVQFRDSADGIVPSQWLDEHWNAVEHIVQWAVEQDGRALPHVPEHLRSHAMCMTAVMRHGAALMFVPTCLLNEEMCWTAVRQDGRALEHVPVHLRTQELCRAAIQQNGEAVTDLPVPLLSEEMCLLAVQQNGMALGCIFRAMRTQAVCMAAVESRGAALAHVPDGLRTEEVCQAALRQKAQASMHRPAGLIVDNTPLVEAALSVSGADGSDRESLLWDVDSLSSFGRVEQSFDV